MSTKSSISCDAMEAPSGQYAGGKALTGRYSWHVWRDAIQDDAVHIQLDGPNLDDEENFGEVFVRIPRAVFDRIAADVAKARR